MMYGCVHACQFAHVDHISSSVFINTEIMCVHITTYTYVCVYVGTSEHKYLHYMQT